MTETKDGPPVAEAPRPVVSFYLPAEPDLARLAGIDPDRDWPELVRGERAWILQTYLRLRRAGEPVTLVGEPPASGLLVYHAKHAKLLVRRAHRLRRAVLVGVRADNRESTLADFEVVQNGVYADGKRRFFVNHWPQPSLLPRDPARGTAIRRLEFKGFANNLHPAFGTGEWARFLAERGIEWAVDAVRFGELGSEPAAHLAWNDFRTTDLVLAVRPGDPARHTNKPATKLVNAWLAGVPALLGPEPAYRELRRDPLDYLEVPTLEEAMAAVERLRAEPELYRRMVEHGRLRAVDYTAAAIVPQWVELLWRTLPALARRRPLRHLPHLLRPLLRRTQRLLTGRPAR